MTKVLADITISLDGFVTAEGADEAHGLGIDGEVLHDWVFQGTDEDRAVLDEAFAATGAVIMGRRLFDTVDGPDGWNDEIGYGADSDQSVAPPVFVVTHHPPGSIRLVDRMHIVTDGLQSALDQARAAAADKDVVVMGGGETIAAFLAAGLVDELMLHIAPVALGGGRPLFHRRVQGLRLLSSVTTVNATHNRYAVERS